MSAYSQEEVGKIDNVIGDAEIYNGKNVQPIKKELIVHPSDIIVTKENALVKILFFDGADIIMYEKTELKIKEYKVNIDTDKKSLKSVFEDIKGKIRFFVKPDKNINNDVKYKTSNAVMGVRGTGGFIVAPDIGQTQLVVTTGTVQLSNPANPDIVQEVKENQWGKVEANKPPPAPEPVTPELLQTISVTLPEGFDTPSPSPSSEETKQKDDKDLRPKELPSVLPNSPPPVLTPELGKDSEEKDSKEKDDDSEYFRIGPMVSFGLFNFFSIGIEARLFHFIGLGVSYGGMSKINLKNYPNLENKINNNNDNTPVQNTDGDIQHVEARLVVYPFFGSFYIGTALGIRHLNSTINACEFISGFGNFNSCVPLSAQLKVDTTYVTPQFGWIKVWKNGFTIGTELGAQIPLNSGNESFSSQILTNDSNQYNLVANSYAYQNFQSNIRDKVGDYFRSKVLPFWNILKIGFMF
jgi:virulence-associated protein VapD